jgi:uncharacterized membrane protein YczE
MIGSMFKPIYWKTFARDFLVIQIGFLLFGLSIALVIRANLGTGPWAMLEVALSQIYGLTPGTMSVIVGFVVLIASLLMREQVGWGTLGNMIFIGPWEDLALYLIPSVKGNFLIQGAMLLLGILIMGIASAVYIGVNAGAGPRDSMMLAVKRLSRRSLRLARASIEVILVLVAWLLGGPIGIGTLIFAILIGPSVQWAFKVFRVQPHQHRDA